MLTSSEDTATIQRIADDDYTRYYDSADLLEMEPHVRHFNIYTATTPEHPW